MQIHLFWIELFYKSCSITPYTNTSRGNPGGIVLVILFCRSFCGRSFFC